MSKAYSKETHLIFRGGTNLFLFFWPDARSEIEIYFLSFLGFFRSLNIHPKNANIPEHFVEANFSEQIDRPVARFFNLYSSGICILSFMATTLSLRLTRFSSALKQIYSRSENLKSVWIIRYDSYQMKRYEALILCRSRRTLGGLGVRI